MNTAPWSLRDLLKQFLLSVVVSMSFLSVGLSMGWSANGLPSLFVTRPDIVKDYEEGSWVAATPSLGGAVVSMFSGKILDFLGRKRTLLLTPPLFIGSFLLIAFAVNFPMLLTGRFICGLATGVAMPAGLVYISECSRPEVRGRLGSMPPIFMALGILLGYIIGTNLPWNYSATVSTSIPLMFFFLLLPFPESPTWLTLKGRVSEADKANQWFNKSFKQNAIKNHFAMSDKISDDNVSTETVPADEVAQQSNPRSVYLTKAVMHPFAISTTIVIFQQFAGMNAMLSFTVNIFEAAHTGWDSRVEAIIVGAVQAVSCFLSLFIVDGFGRKPLLYVSGTLTCVSNFILGIYFQYEPTGIMNNFRSLPLICLCVFVVGYAIGFLPIPYLLIGEILPRKQRSILSSCSCGITMATMFIVIKTFPTIMDDFGIAGVFWLYSGFCFFSCIFVRVFVPETKGRTLKEIEEFFK